MKGPRSLALLTAAALIAVFAVPAGAAPPSSYHESGTFRGTAAVAQWSAGEQGAPVGHPRALFVGGYDATVMSHAAGSKPQRMQQPSFVAMGIELPGPGGEPYNAEIWGMADQGSFTINRELTKATLVFDCDAMVLTGDDEPSDVTIPLSVTATWIGVGPLVTEKSLTKGSEEGGWWMDRNRTKVRQATAEVTITGPNNVVFFTGTIDPETDGSGEVDMFTTNAGHLYHTTMIQ